jgi:hypothetical protein
MESRNSQILSIRPTLNVSVANSSSIEIFQTETLRPILKLQNPLIISYTKYFLKQNCKYFNALKSDEQKRYIRQSFKRDPQLSAGLKQLIIAFFTLDELSFYFEQKAEINRRLSELLIERVCSQIELLY